MRGEPVLREAEQFTDHADALVNGAGSDALAAVALEKRPGGAIKLRQIDARCSELVLLNIENIDLNRRTLSIYSEKTNTFNVHQLQKHTEAAARVYLAQLNRSSGPLFEGYGGQRITARAVNKRVGVIGELLGFTQKRLSPHDLRHFFTFDALEHGLPLDLVQAIGGWTSPYMPLLYAKRSTVRVWKIERDR